MAIEISQKYLEFTPGFSIGNYCNGFAYMLTDGGWFYNVAGLHGSQHRKDNGAILAAPHDMVLEFLCVDSRARNSRNVNKGPELSKP